MTTESTPQPSSISEERYAIARWSNRQSMPIYGNVVGTLRTFLRDVPGGGRIGPIQASTTVVGTTLPSRVFSSDLLCRVQACPRLRCESLFDGTERFHLSAEGLEQAGRTSSWR